MERRFKQCTALSCEIVYAMGEVEIDAGVAEDACRIILFYDQQPKKAALLQTNDMKSGEHEKMISSLKQWKFNPVTILIYLCGDEDSERNRLAGNDEILQYIERLNFTVERITNGKEKKCFLKSLSG